MSNPRLSVVIPTHNRASLLHHCLRALEGQTAPRQSFEVVVVDNGSTYDTRELLASTTYDLHLQTFFLPDAGPNQARNHAGAAATAELLLFLGDDMLADRGLVAAHLAAHDKHPEEHVGVLGDIGWAPELLVSPFRRYVGEPNCPFQFCFTGFDPDDVPVGRMYGSHHSVKRSFFMQHGGFDPAFALPAYDDVELEYRYRRSGFRLVYQPEARLHYYHPYDLAAFIRQMHTAGRAAVHLYRKHPESVVLTDLGTLLALRPDPVGFEQCLLRLQEEESLLAELPEESAEYQEHYASLRPQWRELLNHSAAAGAWEGLRECGWSDLATVLRGRKLIPGGLVRKRVAIFLGQTVRQLGLELATGDSRFEVVTVEDRQALRLHESPSAGYHLYFRVDRAFAAANDTPLQVTVEYLDQGSCSWRLDYDSVDAMHQIPPEPPGAFKASRELIWNEDSGQWRRATFRLDDWLFLNRCHGGDFRIAVEADPGVGLCVSKVEVEALAAPTSSEAEAAWRDSSHEVHCPSS